MNFSDLKGFRRLSTVNNMRNTREESAFQISQVHANFHPEIPIIQLPIFTPEQATVQFG